MPLCQNEIHGSILLPDEEEILVREELRRLASTPDSDYSDVMGGHGGGDGVGHVDGRPDSRVMLELDDEDRIPEEQLLKYTKPDSPLPQQGDDTTSRSRDVKLPSQTVPTTTAAAGAAGPPPPLSPHSTRRSKTPDQILHAQES